MDPTLISGIAGTVFGSFGMQVVKMYFDHRKAKAELEAKEVADQADHNDEATERLLRVLQDQIEDLRTQVRRLNEEQDHWRTRYFELSRDHAVLKEAHDALRKQYRQLEDELGLMRLQPSPIPTTPDPQ